MFKQPYAQSNEYPTLVSCCLPQEKSLQARGSGVRSKWRLQDKQDCREVTSSSVTVLDNSHSYLRHATRKEEFWAPRWKLGWSDRRSDEQTRSKWEPYPSFMIAESRTENRCFMTSSSRRLIFCANQTPEWQEHGNHFHHLHPLSFLHWSKKKKKDMANHQNKEFRSKDFPEKTKGSFNSKASSYL